MSYVVRSIYIHLDMCVFPISSNCTCTMELCNDRERTRLRSMRNRCESAKLSILNGIVTWFINSDIMRIENAVYQTSKNDRIIWITLTCLISFLVWLRANYYVKFLTRKSTIRSLSSVPTLFKSLFIACVHFPKKHPVRLNTSSTYDLLINTFYKSRMTTIKISAKLNIVNNKIEMQ